LSRWAARNLSLFLRFLLKRSNPKGGGADIASFVCW
jgi:hypothetical protein